MKRHIQLDPLLINQVELGYWSTPVHTHDFYELIFIHHGKGYHTINDNRFPYTSGNVFLVGPTDNHFFTIDELTSFCFITFSESYLTSLTSARLSVWNRLKNNSLHTALGFAGNLMITPTDQLHLTTLLAILITEKNDLGQSSAAVAESIMSAILSLVERRITHLDTKSIQCSLNGNNLIQQLIPYISQHITEPDRVRIEQLADTFHYSPGHLSALFKQHIGQSLQQYIIQYRLNLVEKRLRLSALTVSQIADEFGFTDICHLNKLFKQYYRYPPMVYRRAITAL